MFDNLVGQCLRECERGARAGSTAQSRPKPSATGLTRVLSGWYWI